MAISDGFSNSSGTAAERETNGAVVPNNCPRIDVTFLRDCPGPWLDSKRCKACREQIMPQRVTVERS